MSDPVSWSLSESRRYGLPATLTASQWSRTIADFGERCAYCQSASWASIEHFVPVRRGGGTTAGNCLPACTGCNAKKGSRTGADLVTIFGQERASELAAYLRSRSSGPDVGPEPEVFDLDADCDRRSCDPGGKWFSTRAHLRKHKPRTLTLSPAASAALDALHARPGGDSFSGEASAAILERVKRLLPEWEPPNDEAK